ncbi:hypothetical protein QUF61_10490 [Candidatus Venteria ishoeyi]|uniref:hypothetical protein n=1 Tax=Candidatus Venteria ishoeyi TaxID=1899563 RepID=UPI0025A59026|nr:hypothetical protein [Candidatus Venteria ishoeyi]MDM8546911.1 hypothetical protein [Candidatus Venteria ishoeyi]
MRSHVASVFLLIFLIAMLMFSLYLDWFSGSQLLTVGMAFIGLVGLVTVLKLPWDLYFEARNLLAEQKESLRRGIEVPAADHQYTQAIAKRLLWVCIGLHLLSALVITLLTYFSGAQIGYYFAGFFLLSTGFRPLLAFYQHQKARFAALRRRCKVPREDALDFAGRIKKLEKQLEAMEKQDKKTEEKNQQAFLDVQADLDHLHTLMKKQNRNYEEKTDKVCDEFSHAVEKLSSDQEFLSGMRAFIKMIKTSP